MPALGVHVAALAAWLVGTQPGSEPAWFAPIAVATVAAGSALSFAVAPVRSPVRRWWALAYLALLVLVPSVLALRLAAVQGVGTAPGPEGTLQGNWLLVNLPTLSLELFAIGVWVLLLVSTPRFEALRQRWKTFLPFAALPLGAAAILGRPIILSATISWGTNLAVFVPAPVSLSVAVVSVACYASALLLVRRHRRDRPWALLAFGTLAIVLSGFYASMASVEGLTFGLLLVGIALKEWPSAAGPA